MNPLLRCPWCDLLQRGPVLRRGESAQCSRCDGVLYREKPSSLERSLSLTVTALVLWIVANFYPFMNFSFKGGTQSNFIVSGVFELHANGATLLAGLVLFTSVLAPFFYLAGMLYVLAPLRFGFRPPGLAPVFRALVRLRPWSMLEVYLLGVLVAIVKLGQLASIDLATAFYAFTVLIFVFTASSSALDPRVVWDRLEISR